VEAGYPDRTLEFYPGVSPLVLVACFLLLMLLVNMLQIEYVFGTLKLLFIVVMIMLNFFLHVLQPVKRGPFWTYNEPYGFASQNITLPNGAVVTGGVGQRMVFPS
jgi:yeast amino acid transporter